MVLTEILDLFITFTAFEDQTATTLPGIIVC